MNEGRAGPRKENAIHERRAALDSAWVTVSPEESKGNGERTIYIWEFLGNIGDGKNCTSIMYRSTMCSSVTGPLWDLYISTSSMVGTYLEHKNKQYVRYRAGF